VLSAVVIGVQVTLLLTIVGLSQGMLADSQNRVRNAGADIWIKPEAGAGLTLSTAQINEKFVPFIAKQPHVEHALGVVIAQIQAFTSIAGVDYDQFLAMNGGIRYLAGGPLKGQDDVIIDEYYAREHKTHVGDQLRLLNHDWRVAGIVEQAKVSHLITFKKRLQELTSNDGRVTQILVKLDNQANQKAVLSQLNEKLKGELRAYSIEELASLYTINSFPQLQTFINVVIGLSISIGFLVVFLSMYTAVLERTREIGVLKALGAKPFTIVDILIRETIVLAIVGSAIGILLSYAAKGLIMALIPASLQVISVPDWWPRAALIAVVGALLGAIYPGIKAARQDAIEALSYD
jgi:putative ABC transport system permease protein